MKNSINIQLFALLLALGMVSFTNMPSTPLFEVEYKIGRVCPAISISKGKATTAKSLSDLNAYYESTWIKEYKSVEITAFIDGVSKTIHGDDDQLNTEQLKLISEADLGSDINVNVQYLPDNDLKFNDIKEINFSFSIDADKEAQFPGGNSAIQDYLDETVMSKLSIDIFKEHKITAVTFSVNEKGDIHNVEIYDTPLPKVRKLERVLYDAICNMPKWTPAEFADGTKTSQDFVLTAGDHMSCTINMLNICSVKEEAIKNRPEADKQ